MRSGALIVGAACLLGATAKPLAAASLLEGDERLRSIVYIECEYLATASTRGDGQEQVQTNVRRSGTGIIIDDKGTILTASHLVPGRPIQGTGRTDYSETRCLGERGSAARVPVRRLINPAPVGSLDAITLRFVPDPGETFAPFTYVPSDQVSTTDRLFVSGFRAGSFGCLDLPETVASPLLNDDQTIQTSLGAWRQIQMGGSPLIFAATKELVGLVVATKTGEDGRPLEWGILSADAIAGNLNGLRRSQLSGARTDSVRQEDIPADAAAPVVSPIHISSTEDKSNRPPIVEPEDSDVVFDERIRVEDTTRFPASAIVEITPKDQMGTTWPCTGVMVSEDTVLTAGHCIYNPETSRPFEDFTVTPGRNGAVAPFGRCKGVGTYLLPGFAYREDARKVQNNLGAIRLDCRIGLRTGWFGLVTAEESNLEALVWAGYPVDKSPGHSQWTSLMHKVKIENGELKYRTLTITGTGGSPIYDPAGNRLVAIHWRGAIPHDPFRAGTRITQSRIRIIQSWIDSDRGPLARNSVAHVTCSDPTTGRLTEGTGVIVSAEGHLVTAGSVASGAVSCTAAIGDSLAPREPLEMVGPLANGRLMVLRLSSPEGAQPVALPKDSIPSLNESAQIAAFLPGEFGSYSRRTGKILETRDAYFELDNADGGVLAGGAVVDAEERLLGLIFGIRRKEDGTLSTLVANVSAIAGELEALTSGEPQ